MDAHRLAVVLRTQKGSDSILAPVSTAVIAGWTGRDRDAVAKHVRELEELGVRPPSTTPIFYRVSATRLSVTDHIQVSGVRSSGEVEFVLAQWRGKLWVGVGSDHTDRDVETYSVTVSKQMCDKPVAPEFWSFEDVVDHWDALVLRSFIREGGQRVLYQEGVVSGLLDPTTLIRNYCDGGELPEGALMFCGTFPAKGGIRQSDRFEFEIEDPILGRTIRSAYDIESLPVRE